MAKTQTVTAKPFGWNEHLSPVEALDHDPYEGNKDPVTGELEIVDVPADYDLNSPAYKLYLVDNVSVDPDTIEETILSSAIEFHADHDQSSHGNWATGTTKTEIRNFGMESWKQDRRDTVLNTVKGLADKYPGVEEKNGQISINAGDNNANMAIQVESLAAVDEHAPTHIDINPRMRSQNWLKMVAPDYTVSGDNLEQVLTHEFGHVVELALPLELHTEAVRPFREALDDWDSINYKKNYKSNGKFRNLMENVSQYATHDAEEGFAEAFLQHELGIHNEYSDHVGEVLSQWKVKEV